MNAPYSCNGVQARPMTRRQLLQSVAAGFGWMRFRLPWDEIEPTPNVYAWDAADAAVWSGVGLERRGASSPRSASSVWLKTA